MTWSLDDPMFALDETAAQLLERCRRRVLRTGITALDAALDGLHPGEMLELWSKKGSVTTEMIHQIVAWCVLPRSAGGVPLGGEEKKVVFIDTGRKFDTERLESILRGIISRMIQAAHWQELDIEDVIEGCLSQIQVYECVDYVELILALEHLKTLPFCEPSRQAGSWLLAIDTITQFHYNARFERTAGPQLENQIGILIGYLMRDRGAVAVTALTAYRQSQEGTVQDFWRGTWSRLNKRILSFKQDQQQHLQAQLFNQGSLTHSFRVNFDDGIMKWELH